MMKSIVLVDTQGVGRLFGIVLDISAYGIDTVNDGIW